MSCIWERLSFQTPCQWGFHESCEEMSTISRSLGFQGRNNLDWNLRETIANSRPTKLFEKSSSAIYCMHSVSESLEQNLGDCPVFTPCCPLKTVQSAGVKLVESPESVSAEQLGQKEKFKAEISVGVIKFPPSINMKSYKREQRSDKLYFNIVNITRTRQYFHDVTQQAKPKKICIWNYIYTSENQERLNHAFKETCPFAKLGNEDVKNCRKFIDGCPFKNANNLAEVYDLLAKIPLPHTQGGNILDTLKNIHIVSANEESVFGECPVFHDEPGKLACPFKSVQNEGKHLVQPVKQVVQE